MNAIKPRSQILFEQMYGVGHPMLLLVGLHTQGLCICSFCSDIRLVSLMPQSHRLQVSLSFQLTCSAHVVCGAAEVSFSFTI